MLSRRSMSGDAFGDQTLQLDTADFGAVLFALAALLGGFIVGEPTFGPQHGAMKDIDRRPEQFLEFRLEPCIGQRRDERIEHVRDRAGDKLRFRQLPRVGFALEGTKAIELQLGENAIGRRGREG
jgi:hypothetical protein